MDYVRHILVGVDRLFDGAQVTLLTSEAAAQHPSCRRLTSEFGHLLIIRIAPPVTEANRLLAAVSGCHKALRGYYEYHEELRRAAEKLQRGLAQIGPDNVDFVVLPTADRVGLAQLAFRPRLFAGKPWATIAVGIKFHQRKCGIAGPFRATDVLHALLFRWIVRNPTLACFGTINPYLADYAKHSKVRYCTDPSEPPVLGDPQATRAAYGIRPGSFVVLVYGSLDRRKCIPVLLEAAAQLRDELDLTVLLAGRQHREVVEALIGDAARKLRERESLVEVNRYLIEGTDLEPLGATDVAWVFYDRSFVQSSGAMVRAGLARRPILVRRQGLIGRMVEDHNLGIAVDTEAPDAVAAALKRLALDPALRRELGENGARAFAQNTPENFARPIIEAIRAAVPGAGVGASPERAAARA